MVTVLEGSYIEASAFGRHRYVEGDVIEHGPFTAHADWIGPRVVVLMNCEGASKRGCAAKPPLMDGLPDLLAASIRLDPTLRIVEWCRNKGIDAGQLSREFSLAFGVSPKLYRADVRTRLAWAGASSDQERLSTMAYRLGFSDQAHMCRAVKALTGQSPSQLRKAGSEDRDS